MKGKETAFFAIEDDLFSLLGEIEELFAFQYVTMGNFDNVSEIHKYDTYVKIPDLGFTKYGDWAGLDHRYLLIPATVTLNIEEFLLSKGGKKYIVSPALNRNSIELLTKGIYTKKGNVIIAGRIATVSADEFANNLYKSLLSKIKKKFKRIGGYYVGPKAEEKLKKGWRLVQIENSPREYDLAYPVK